MQIIHTGDVTGDEKNWMTTSDWGIRKGLLKEGHIKVES